MMGGGWRGIKRFKRKKPKNNKMQKCKQVYLNRKE